MIGIKKQTEKYNSQAKQLKQCIIEIRQFRAEFHQKQYDRALAHFNQSVADSWQYIADNAHQWRKLAQQLITKNKEQK